MRAHPRTSDVEFRLTICDHCQSDISIFEERYHCLDCRDDVCARCAPKRPHDPKHVGTWYPGLPVLRGTEREEAKQALREELATKHRFIGSRTFFAGAILPILDGKALSDQLSRVERGAIRQTLDVILGLRKMGRFADFFARKALPGSFIPHYVFIYSQGYRGPNRWKGLPLLKTVYDYALYPILFADIKPRTLIELGTEAGGSAVWFADVVKMLGLDCHLYTMDLKKPDLAHEGVTFMQGDSNKIEEAFPEAMLKGLPHPWILVEDAHVNIDGIIRHFTPYLEPGDYLVIEDNNAEREMGKYLLQHPDAYFVDTYYTDYFGYNATCSIDQIFVRAGDDLRRQVAEERSRAKAPAAAGAPPLGLDALEPVARRLVGRARRLLRRFEHGKAALTGKKPKRG